MRRVLDREREKFMPAGKRSSAMWVIVLVGNMESYMLVYYDTRPYGTVDHGPRGIRRIAAV
jgi:hypothetical protein